ncbi:hypothetical protein [Edaphovirga cremea]|uniref:hypothetical protein n=1 Tax=Edaphovirga cremea TaxID=2267246 RepID=UPI003988B0F1
MYNPYERDRTQEQYTRLLRATPPPAPTPADKERDFQRTLSGFRQVMLNYKTANAHWWYGSMLDMKQRFSIGDMQRESAALDAKQVDIAMSCSKAPLAITVTHGFRSSRYIPIPEATYTLVKRPVMLPNGYAAARFGDFPRNGFTQNDKTVSQGRFDGQGKAVVDLPTCEAGHQYHLLVNTDITESDRQALYAAYQGVIDKYAAWLTTKWNTQQRTAWQAYLLQGGLSVEQAASAFLDGMVSQLKLLYDTVKQVWEWVSNAEKYAAKLADFLGPNGVAQLKTLAEKGDKALGETLTLLSDEILIFILADALYCYFQLLTPQQIVNFVADAFGSLVVMIVLYLVLPGGLGKLVLDGVDNLGMMVPARG